MRFRRSLMILGLVPALVAPWACGASDSGVGGGVGGTGLAQSGGGGPGPSSTSTLSGGNGGGDAVVDCGADRSEGPHSKGFCVNMIVPGSGGAGGGSATDGASTGTSGQGGGAAAGGGSSTSTSTGSAGGPSCSSLFNPSSCADCIVDSCCAETAACASVDGCIACFTHDANASGCADSPIVGVLDHLAACEKTSCASQCLLEVVYHCNPVTNEGCADGYACDLAASGSFKCFPPPENKQAICESCSVTTSGPYCKGGYHCVDHDPDSTTGRCGAFCCNSDDCGPEGRCDMTVLLDGLPTAVGICVPK